MWPVLLPATQFVRETFVIRRDTSGQYFAIRGTEGGPVLDLNREEGFLFEQIRTSGVQAVLQSYFGSASGTRSLTAAVRFILRLYDSGLLEPLANADLMDSIRRLAPDSETLPQRSHTWQQVQQKGKTAALYIAGHPIVSALVLFGFIAAMFAPSVQNVLSVTNAARMLTTPGEALVTLWLAVLTASTIHSLVAAYMVQGALTPPLRSAIRIQFVRRGLIFLVADFDFNSVDMLSRTDELRMRATFLLMPWVAAGAFAALGGVNNKTTTAIALAFALHGLFETSPHERRQLIALIEAYTRHNHLLENSREFLSKGLFRFDQKISGSESVVATVMIGWLAMLAVYGSDLLTTSIYDLGNTLANASDENRSWSGFANAAASVVWIAMIATVTIGGAFRLISIPFSNAANLAALPLRALRPKTLMDLNSKLSPQSLAAVLRKIPLFAGTTNPVLLSVIHANSRVWQSNPGEAIVRQGEQGHEFHVILDGEFIVQQTTKDGEVSTLQRLIAGDSFGEIALLKKKNRNATVTSRGRGVLLSINSQGFDTLFPEQSQIRTNLTSIIRIIKLLQESDALSYLTPSQMLGVASAMQPRKFSTADILIQEGDTEASCAYLIDSGSVKVSVSGQTMAQGISRGSLIGTTALICNTKRTATVAAESDVTCFEISRKDFLDVCSKNAVITLLIGNQNLKHEQQRNDVHLAATQTGQEPSQSRGVA